jgi:hypothetical protein
MNATKLDCARNSRKIENISDTMGIRLAAMEFLGNKTKRFH